MANKETNARTPLGMEQLESRDMLAGVVELPAIAIVDVDSPEITVPVRGATSVVSTPNVDLQPTPELPAHENGGSTALSTAGVEREVAFQQLYPLTPPAPTDSGQLGARISSPPAHADTEAKIKSPTPGPFTDGAPLDGLFAFFDAFNNLPRNGFAAGIAIIPLADPERLPYQVVDDLSDEQLGNVAAALLWARMHHLDVDVWIHHVRLEIIERFGAEALPLLYR